MRSWIDKEKTGRKYKLNISGVKYCNVINEFQKIPCPNCKKFIYCRLTRISYFNDNLGITTNDEIHTNFNKNLSELKKLLITYLNIDDCKVEVYEVNLHGKWYLKANKTLIGEEII